MSLRLALVVILFAGCDEPDDREARPIVLAPPEQPKSDRVDGVDVSPLTPIVLPEVATPPPQKAEPPPPPRPVEAKSAEPVPAEVAAPPAPTVAEEKPVSPEPPKAPLTKKKRKR